jgi:sugar lactone lactonase YvrE
MPRGEFADPPFREFANACRSDRAAILGAMKTLHSLTTTVVLAACCVCTARGQDFISYQSADVVIGKPNFLTSGPTTASATNTNTTADAVVDPATGKLFVCDEANNRVLRFSSSAAAASGAAAEAVFGQPDLTTATANTGGLGASSLSDPVGIAVDASGALWVADAGNNRVLRYDGATGAVSGATTTADQVIGQATFTASTSGLTLATLNSPRGVWIDGSGNLWVADAGNNRVLRYDAAASLGDGPNASRVIGQPDGTTGAAATTQAGLSGPTSVCVDASGNLWVADTGNNRVLRYASAASISSDGANASSVLGQGDFTTATLATTNSGLNSPRGVNATASGRLWVSDFGNNRVLWFNNAASKANGASADNVLGQPDFTSSVSGLTAQRLNGPLGVFQDVNGRLWVADSANHRVLRFSAQQPSASQQPPVIRLFGKTRRVFPAASQHLRGAAFDADGVVVAVKGSVNGRPFTLARGTSRWVYHAKKLRKGRNIVRIFAVDDDGLQSNMLVVRIIRRTHWRF